MNVSTPRVAPGVEGLASRGVAHCTAACVAAVARHIGLRIDSHVARPTAPLESRASRDAMHRRRCTSSLQAPALREPAATRHASRGSPVFGTSMSRTLHDRFLPAMAGVLGLALVVATGCVPAHTAEAREAALRGAHADALAQWKARLAEAPDDAEARAGVTAATAALLERELARCRSARAGGAWESALLALRSASALADTLSLEATHHAASSSGEEPSSGAQSRMQPRASASAPESPSPHVEQPSPGAPGPSQRTPAQPSSPAAESPSPHVEQPTGAQAPAAELARTALEAERSATARELREAVDALLSMGQPLAAWRFLSPIEPYLADAGLGALGPELRGAVRTAGARRCVATSHLARTAYLADVVRRACEPLGATVPPVAVAAEKRADVTIDVLSLASPTPGARTKLADAARAAFLRSPWADRRAQGAVQARVAGTLESRIESTPLELTVSWTTQEPYTTSESQTESYTESYTTTESYSYTCYQGTRSSTCYGTRTVTRTRPATRTVQKTVTRYRAVAHSRTYPGVQKKAAHRAQVSLAIALPATERALELTWGDSQEKTDVEHTTEDAVAGLAPRKADVPSESDWEDRQARILYEKLSSAMTDTWTKTFCRAGTQPPDDAARCLAGASGEWPDATLALARFLGEPLELVAELVRATRDDDPRFVRKVAGPPPPEPVRRKVAEPAAPAPIRRVVGGVSDGGAP